MSQSKTKRSLLIGVAILIGLAAGSYQPLSRIWQRDPPPPDEPTGTIGASPPTSRKAPPRSATDRATNAAIRPVPAGGPTPTESASVVRVTDGLSLVRAEEDGQFVGYKVLANASDPRFEEGHIITELNGEPVEDSAAGTELLTIGLMNPETAISVVSN